MLLEVEIDQTQKILTDFFQMARIALPARQSGRIYSSHRRFAELAAAIGKAVASSATLGSTKHTISEAHDIMLYIVQLCTYTYIYNTHIYIYMYSQM